MIEYPYKEKSRDYDPWEKDDALTEKDSYETSPDTLGWLFNFLQKTISKRRTE